MLAPNIAFQLSSAEITTVMDILLIRVVDWPMKWQAGAAELVRYMAHEVATEGRTCGGPPIMIMIGSCERYPSGVYRW